MCVDGGKDLNPHFTHILVWSAFICCSYFMHCFVLSLLFLHRLACKYNLVTSCLRHFFIQHQLHTSPETLSKWATAGFFGITFMYYQTILLEYFPVAYSANLPVHFSSGRTTSTLQSHLRREKFNGWEKTVKVTLLLKSHWLLTHGVPWGLLGAPKRQFSMPAKQHKYLSTAWITSCSSSCSKEYTVLARTSGFIDAGSFASKVLN